MNNGTMAIITVRMSYLIPKLHIAHISCPRPANSSGNAKLVTSSNLPIVRITSNKTMCNNIKIMKAIGDNCDNTLTLSWLSAPSFLELRLLPNLFITRPRIRLANPKLLCQNPLFFIKSLWSVGEFINTS